MSEPMTRDPRAVLTHTKDQLEAARNALPDINGPDPRRRLAGLYNVAVWGRAVTNSLQLLRNTEDEFDDGYAPYLAEMSSDPLMKRFYKLRTDALHLIPEGVGTRTHVGYFNTDMIATLPRPPGAKAYFIGDRYGGSGWTIELPDGSEEKVYAELPAGAYVTSELTLSDPPTEHRGEPLTESSAAALAQRYVDYLGQMVKDAAARFSR